MKSKSILFFIFYFLSFTILSGCTIVFQKGRRTDIKRIEELKSQLEQLNQARSLLEERLKQEIADKKVRLEMLEKGLVITIVTDGVLFDSGKAKIKSEAYPILDKVAKVLIENVPENFVGIEGHTDNEPIKYSGWKSNWELSSHRALSVLHYLVKEKGIDPRRVSATGYGEYHPVASNETKEGRKLNRRVEVVILPRISKIKPEEKIPKKLPKELEGLK